MGKSKSKVRERSRDLFAELDREVEKLNKSGDLKVMRDSPKDKPSAKTPSKSKSRAKDQPKPKGAGKLGQAKSKDGRSKAKDVGGSRAEIRQYKESVTKKTTEPATVKGRKGKITTTVTSGTARGGKSDNPEMQRALHDQRIQRKYSGLVRTQGKEAIRDQLTGEDREAFDRVYKKRGK